MGATIAPGKVDRTPWDGLGFVPEGVWKDLGQALRQIEPHAAVLGVLAGLANGTLDKPDVCARVELFVGPYAVARELPKVQDSFTPQWVLPATSFAHVPLDPSLRVRVALTDVDLVNDDPIGFVTLRPIDVERALALGVTHYVDVHEQSDGQVLFVHLQARPEGGGGPP